MGKPAPGPPDLGSQPTGSRLARLQPQLRHHDSESAQHPIQDQCKSGQFHGKQLPLQGARVQGNFPVLGRRVAVTETSSGLAGTAWDPGNVSLASPLLPEGMVHATW